MGTGKIVKLMYGVICASLCLWGEGCAKKEEAKETRKILNLTLQGDVKGFDPVLSNDLYSFAAIQQVYEGLLKFHYLKRPYTVDPLLAAELPTISPDGLVYRFRLREGVVFHPDPAFGGKTRQLTSADVVYSIKRFADPALKSPNWSLLDDRIKGLNEFRRRLSDAKPPIPYDSVEVDGLRAPDERTVEIHLTKRYRQFPYVLTMAPLMIVAKEVVEKYGVEFLNHPVGTGPFRLKDWRRGLRLSFDRHPQYWGDRYPTEGTSDDERLGLLRPAGKKLPFVDEVHYWIYVESQPRWLNLLQGNLDFSSLPKESYDNAYGKDRQFNPDLFSKKMSANVVQGTDVVFFVLNMDDPVLGPNKPLRQALSAAINRQEKIALLYNHRAIEAHGPIPPDVFGYQKEVVNPYRYNLELARERMAAAREVYRQKGGKGDLPPILYDTLSDTTSRQLAETVEQDLAKIGLKVNIRQQSWPQFQERLQKGQVQFSFYAWMADYPDPENFLQLFYSKNVSPGPNSSNFRNAQYDSLFEKVRDMQDTPQRSRVIQEMVAILQEEVPTIFFNHRMLHGVQHGWLKNVKRNSLVDGLSIAQTKYLDIALDEKRTLLPLLK